MSFDTTLTTGGGPARARPRQLPAAASARQAHWHLQLRGTHLRLERALEQLLGQQKPHWLSGLGHLTVDLSTPLSERSSAARPFEHLSGKVLVQLEPGQYLNQLSSLGGTPFSELFKALLPLKPDHTGSDNANGYLSYHCAVANLALVNGLAHLNKNLAIETPFLDLIGSGKISIAEKKLELLIKPVSKTSLSIPIPALAEGIEVSGPWTSPRVSLSAPALIKQGASLFASLASSGVSLLMEKALDTSGRDPHPCQTALQ